MRRFPPFSLSLGSGCSAISLCVFPLARPYQVIPLSAPGAHGGSNCPQTVRSTDPTRQMISASAAGKVDALVGVTLRLRAPMGIRLALAFTVR